MPSVPISELDNFVKDTLTAIRNGAKDFAHDSGVGVRLGVVNFDVEVVFTGDEIVQSRQETTQEQGQKTTTTTEQPIGTDVNSHGEVTTTVKSGNYVQAGTQTTGQGGGSSETTTYQYDEA